MFGHIVTYIGGIATGIALLAINRRSVEAAVAQHRNRSDAEIRRLREENTQLRGERDYYVQEKVRETSYRDGFNYGRQNPMSEAEQFAQQFAGKNVSFRNTSRRTTSCAQQSETATGT